MIEPTKPAWKKSDVRELIGLAWLILAMQVEGFTAAMLAIPGVLSMATAIVLYLNGE